MAITSINNSTYTAPLGSTATPVSKQSIGKDLLTALSLNQAGQKSMLSSDLQDQVSLSSLSQTNKSSPLTYDAKSLLQQLQNNMQRNNPMWQDENSNSNSSSGSSLTNTVLNALNAKQNGSSTSTTGSTSNSATNSTNLVDLVKNSPGMAKALIYSQNSQSMLSMLE